MATNWAELHHDLLVLIVKRVKVIEDFIAFGAVCTSWKAAASKDKFDVQSPQVPLLILGAKKDDDYREFYNLSTKKVSRIFLPEARGTECFSSEGWLCTVSCAGMSLLHPFSSISTIKLPSRKDLLTLHGFDFEEEPEGKLWYCMDKAVLSASPSLTSDYALVVHYYSDRSCLAYWRPGDLNWTSINIRTFGCVTGMIYYEGQFYCITYRGDVWVFNVPDPKPCKLLELMEDEMFNIPSVQFYLVEVSGALLLVTRYAKEEHRDPIRSFTTFKIQLFELDLIKGELKEEIKTLGDSTIFLGRNAASCIDSSKFIGVKPNHIYFTDDWLEYDRRVEGGAGRDMGTYNLKDGKVESFYPGESVSLMSAPTWVTPSF